MKRLITCAIISLLHNVSGADMRTLSIPLVKHSNTSKALKETVTATTTILGVEAGEGTMSMDSSERALKTFGIAQGYEDSEIQNGPVFIEEST